MKVDIELEEMDAENEFDATKEARAEAHRRSNSFDHCTFSLHKLITEESYLNQQKTILRLSIYCFIGTIFMILYVIDKLS
jgi:hypothetical protein